MLIGCMRVSSESDGQTTDLQRDALLAAGVDGRHLFTSRTRNKPRGVAVGLSQCRDKLNIP
jgi:hypothetical protein